MSKNKTPATPKAKAPADSVPVDASYGGNPDATISDATVAAKPRAAAKTKPVDPGPPDEEVHQSVRPDSGYRPANADIPTSDKRMMIEATNLKKHFGKQKVLDGVTFGIPEGEITMIMGPSGTGKSVFLRHVVGLMFPDDGEIKVDGKSVPHLNNEDLLALRQECGMLFQDGALFSSMSLFDNVAFPLRQHTNKGEKEISDIVYQRLKEVGLAGADKKFPNELSGGMRKRAGFARALVMQPRILLIDEPDSGLDPVRTALLSELIREISEKYHCTTIIISHDVNRVRSVADNLAVLYAGKCVAFGSQKEIWGNQDPFIQQFLVGAAQGPLGMD
ncbi:MAG TPA: ABC transporter ATP-binding protein [Candidatus Dormibacteraeota bacterium]|jgi:phospholipid/cholesterol/gamma-HCH transport system ATP-binding protein|nr:ABC transporter ATP-binding protein [Candidatus Dormibacteraeota bacterium]